MAHGHRGRLCSIMQCARLSKMDRITSEIARCNNQVWVNPKPSTTWVLQIGGPSPSVGFCISPGTCAMFGAKLPQPWHTVTHAYTPCPSSPRPPSPEPSPCSVRSTPWHTVEFTHYHPAVSLPPPNLSCPIMLPQRRSLGRIYCRSATPCHCCIF